MRPQEYRQVVVPAMGHDRTRASRTGHRRGLKPPSDGPISPPKRSHGRVPLRYPRRSPVCKNSQARNSLLDCSDQGSPRRPAISQPWNHLRRVVMTVMTVKHRRHAPVVPPPRPLSIRYPARGMLAKGENRHLSASFLTRGFPTACSCCVGGRPVSRVPKGRHRAMPIRPRMAKPAL